MSKNLLLSILMMTVLVYSQTAYDYGSLYGGDYFGDNYGGNNYGNIPGVNQFITVDNRPTAFLNLLNNHVSMKMRLTFDYYNRESGNGFKLPRLSLNVFTPGVKYSAVVCVINRDWWNWQNVSLVLTRTAPNTINFYTDNSYSTLSNETNPLSYEDLENGNYHVNPQYQYQFIGQMTADYFVGKNKIETIEAIDSTGKECVEYFFQATQNIERMDSIFSFYVQASPQFYGRGPTILSCLLDKCPPQ
jgi:hypothetical protein